MTFAPSIAILLAATTTIINAAPNAPAKPAQQTATDQWPELDPKAPRRAFLDAAFADGDGEPRGISQVQLSRWLQSLPGPNYRLMETPRGKGNVAGFEGTARLLAPWPADAVLSIAPFEHHTLMIYFWNGRDGVSLHYYQHPRPTWAAYRTTRKESEPAPATFTLLATDNEACGRSLGGALEIRHQAGHFIVSRGNLRLLTFPFAAPPTEVFFDKRAWFRTFTMYRGEPFPDDGPQEKPAAPAANVLGKSSPASLDWTILPGDGSRLIMSQKDGIELSSDVMAATTWAGLKVPRPGLYEIVFRIGEASAATGFYLGDDAGKPLYVLGIIRDQRTKQPVLHYLQPNGGNFEIGTDINQLQVPFIGPGQWLRLVAGSGTIKCWTSGDGVHWSRALDPLRGIHGAWSHLGLISFKWNEPRRIALEHVRVSELSGISELADEKLRNQVPAAVVAGDPNPPAWQTRVNDSLPAGMDLPPWRNACAIRTVAALPPSQLGNFALNGLAEDIIVRQVPAARRRAALDQIAELYDGWEPPDSFRLSQFYERLGRRLVYEGERRPWTAVGSHLVVAPIWTHAQYQTIPESLANAELLFHIYADEWGNVRQLCRELTLLNRPGPPEQSWPDHRQRVRLLVEWARATADRDRVDAIKNEKPGADKQLQAHASTLPFHWQHALVADLSKEGFNTLAELEATLAEKSYREACQIISSARPELTTGLLPDGRDPRLLLSLPQAVDVAMHDDPALRETMVGQFGAAGKLRLQQALAEGNARQVQALTVQFSGTPAAAAAHEWLGNRALEIGDFAWAFSQFEQALGCADRAQRPAIAAHWRLAAALLGRDAGEPPTAPVAFQGQQIAADAFEKLVAEMKQRAGAKVNSSASPADAAPKTAVKAVRYEIVQRASLRGDVGDQAGNPISGDVDWAARQIGCTISGPMLYVTNRFQVAAINLKTSQQFWSQPVGKEQGWAHGWNLCQSRPVVIGESLLVRRMAKTNPELASFNVATGLVRWTTRNTVNVLSDPLLVQDRLFVFTSSTPHENGVLSIEYSLVDQANGDIVAQQPVILLRNLWDRQLSCQATVAGTRIVGLCGGTAFCCDFGGRPRWVRRQLWIPPSQAPAANEQSPQAPLVIGNRLFVSQPGVFAVECLDLDTGRRVWQAPIPELRRLVGFAGPRLVVETARGWQAYAPETGKLLWQHEGEQILDAQICPASGDLLVAQREQQPGDQWRAVLVWLSAETGQETARQPLPAFVDKQPMLGPLIVDGDRLWAFFGRGVKDPYRDLFELTPTGDPAQAPRTTASIGQ